MKRQVYEWLERRTDESSEVLDRTYTLAIVAILVPAGLTLQMTGGVKPPSYQVLRSVDVG